MKKGTSATLHKKLYTSSSEFLQWIDENYGSEVFYSRLLLTAHLTKTCLRHISLITLRFTKIFECILPTSFKTFLTRHALLYFIKKSTRNLNRRSMFLTGLQPYEISSSLNSCISTNMEVRRVATLLG
jgi:hypothetical protein